MRITNSMVRNNVKISLNRRRESLMDVDRQIHSTKRIQRPSDNPIIAARTLKFRTTISEISQYMVNAEDAKNWIDVTQKSVNNTIEVLRRIYTLSNQGANGPLVKKDREALLEEVKQLRQQLMTEGNTSYAGRYVFSGYKTDIPLMFEEDSDASFQITEEFTKASVEKINRVFDNDVNEVHRIRLAYKDLDDIKNTNLTGLNITSLESTDPNAYKLAGAGEVHYIKDTGELILHKDDIGNLPEKIEITYEKENFKEGDPRPDLYFKCKNLKTNKEYSAKNEDMEYQISYSQYFAVNTMGRDVFDINLLRDIDEIIQLTSNISEEDTVENKLKKSELTKQFASFMDKIQKHQQTAINVEAKIGAKINRLNLTIRRLEDDKLNFKELLSETEDTNMAEAYIEFEAQLTAYNAALNSGARVMQPTLLDFMR